MTTTIEAKSALPDTGHERQRFLSDRPDEVVAQCPSCKTLETLLISSDGHLITTRKFYQNEKGVYHDCGATEPCRLCRG